MNTLYRKVEIKNEQDLPKEKDKYFVKLKHGIRTVCNFHSRNHKIWLEQVDWYLQPVEPEEPEIIQDDKKEEPQWHLNCTKCEKPYWDNQPFPAFQLCPECKRTRIEPQEERIPNVGKTIELRKELIGFARQFYADEETCIHNVDQYLTSKKP